MDGHKNTKPAGHPPSSAPPSSAQLLAEAKYLAEAAQHAFRKETDQIDKAKAANAAGDLLEAAKKYGNLDQKGFGQYIQQAETYLHKYGASAAAHNPSHAPPPHNNPSNPAPFQSAASHAPAQGKHQPESGGEIGDYMKLAQQFMK